MANRTGIGYFAKGNKLAPGSAGQLRGQEMTQVLVSILNEIDPSDPRQRSKMYRVCSNLVDQATISADVYEEKEVTRFNKRTQTTTTYKKRGKLVQKGCGELMAIKEIFDRTDGKPKQVIVGPNNGPVVVEYRTYEQIRIALLDKGIDMNALPKPIEAIADMTREDEE